MISGATFIAFFFGIAVGYIVVRDDCFNLNRKK